MDFKAALFAYCPRVALPFAARFRTDSLGGRLARGTFWSLAGTLVARGSGLAASILTARVLGKQEFGEFGIIQSTLSLFGLFAGFGMGLTATKHVAEFRVNDPELAGRILCNASLFSWVSGVFLACVLYVSAPWLAVHTLAAPHLAGLLRASTILLVLTSWQGAQMGALAGFEVFKTIAKLNVASGLISFPLVVGGAVWLGLRGAIWATVVVQLIVCVVNTWALRRTAEGAGVPLRFSPKYSDVHLILRFSFPAFVSGAMVLPINWLCNAILVNQPSGYGEMGILNAASQWRNAILFLPTVVSNVSLPLLASLQSPAHAGSAKRLLWNSVKLNAGAAMSAVVVVSACAPLIMSGYDMSSKQNNLTLVVLCLSAGLSGTIGVMGQYIASRGMMWWGTALNLVWGCVLLIGAWQLRGWGALGIAWANLLAYGVHLCTVGWFTLHFLRNKS